MIYIVFVLFVDCMMNLGRHVSVFESRFLTLLMLCCGVSVTDHQLSNLLFCILMYVGCHCRPLGTGTWHVSCFFFFVYIYIYIYIYIYVCVCVLCLSISLAYSM